MTMTKRAWVVAAGAALVLVAAFLLTRSYWTSNNAAAQSARTPARVVPIDTAIAEKKQVPVRVEALGNVTPIASVAIKSRVETTITGVHFQDGARVKAGDLLFTLDSRQIEAEIKRVQAVIAGAEAQLDQAERDVQRYSELVAKNAATQVTLNNSQTQVNLARATAESNKATLENLRVQLDFTKIRAPISGRVSAANVKVGNFVRPADTAPLVTINQMAPVYVSFTVPQRLLPDIRQAIAAETATVESAVQGDTRKATGAVSMIENSVDTTTGMVMVRATMPNADELLWPGTLVNTQMTMRMEEGVVVPSVAVQVSQTGTFVFIVEDATAKVRPVKVGRVVGNTSVISDGLKGGETVVIDGQLLLSDGTKVSTRESKPGS
jgi:RND family efflux transporter MFP subunit